MGREMSEDEINAAAYEGEKGYHGTPSGIDNTAATYGGVIHFERRSEGNLVKQVRKFPVASVMSNPNPNPN